MKLLCTILKTRFHSLKTKQTNENPPETHHYCGQKARPPKLKHACGKKVLTGEVKLD